jgi:transglutaminase-like putative cysteine protease
VNWAPLNLSVRAGRNLAWKATMPRPELIAHIFPALEVSERRYGVSRDFVHAAIPLCRAINLPARHVTGHLPDIGSVNPGTWLAFHPCCEVYPGQEWLT